MFSDIDGDFHIKPVLGIFNFSYYMRRLVALLHYCIKKCVDGGL